MVRGLIISTCALLTYPLVLWSDALLGSTLHWHVEVLHHGNLSVPSKLLIHMCLIQLLLNVRLEAKRLLHLSGELSHPRGLDTHLHLEILII